MFLSWNLQIAWRVCILLCDITECLWKDDRRFLLWHQDVSSWDDQTMKKKKKKEQEKKKNKKKEKNWTLSGSMSSLLFCFFHLQWSLFLASVRMCQEDVECLGGQNQTLIVTLSSVRIRSEESPASRCVTAPAETSEWERRPAGRIYSQTNSYAKLEQTLRGDDSEKESLSSGWSRRRYRDDPKRKEPGKNIKTSEVRAEWDVTSNWPVIITHLISSHYISAHIQCFSFHDLVPRSDVTHRTGEPQGPALGPLVPHTAAAGDEAKHQIKDARNQRMFDFINKWKMDS